MSGTSNIADQVLEGLSMVNNHEFVQEAVYTNVKYKPPSFICYAKSQFEDMKPHLQIWELGRKNFRFVLFGIMLNK
jgi:hypothetical protein